MPLPGYGWFFHTSILGVAEDYDPTFLCYFPLETCFSQQYLKYCEDYSLPLQFPIVLEYYSVSLRETRVHFWCVSMKVRGKFCISESIELLGNFVVLLVHFFFFFNVPYMPICLIRLEKSYLLVSFLR
jgi:hypothetical protein